jgi:hypothetical protein
MPVVAARIFSGVLFCINCLKTRVYVILNLRKLHTHFVGNIITKLAIKWSSIAQIGRFLANPNGKNWFTKDQAASYVEGAAVAAQAATGTSCGALAACGCVRSSPSVRMAETKDASSAVRAKLNSDPSRELPSGGSLPGRAL